MPVIQQNMSCSCREVWSDMIPSLIFSQDHSSDSHMEEKQLMNILHNYLAHPYKGKSKREQGWPFRQPWLGSYRQRAKGCLMRAI